MQPKCEIRAGAAVTVSCPFVAKGVLIVARRGVRGPERWTRNQVRQACLARRGNVCGGCLVVSEREVTRSERAARCTRIDVSRLSRAGDC